MAHIEVLLREHVDPLGKCGDVVRVRPGYARNYLFPNRLAVEANDDNRRAMQRRRTRLDLEEAERNKAIDERVQRLGGVAVTTRAKADENGHLFGSVNAAAIVELLAKAGHVVEERDVRLDAALKTLGAHVVKIHVHGDRSADITVDIQPET